LGPRAEVAGYWCVASLLLFAAVAKWIEPGWASENKLIPTQLAPVPGIGLPIVEAAVGSLLLTSRLTIRRTPPNRLSFPAPP
jgi:predicted membrane-bound mannosyltransferase